MATIVIISGSPWKGTRLQGLINYCEQYLTKKNHTVKQLHVSDLPAEDLMFANFKSEAILDATALVAEADAVILASPVYKASITGLLKTFLDILPQHGFENKTIFPVMIGGTISHLLAIDYSLKPLLSVMGAETIIKGVYAVDEMVVRSEDGSLKLKQEIVERLDLSLERLDYHLNQKTVTNV